MNRCVHIQEHNWEGERMEGNVEQPAAQPETLERTMEGFRELGEGDIQASCPPADWQNEDENAV